MFQLQKHESHRGRYFKYGVRVLDNVYGRPTKRMLSEMVRIESMNEEECFNRKKGWSYTTIQGTYEFELQYD